MTRFSLFKVFQGCSQCAGWAVFSFGSLIREEFVCKFIQVAGRIHLAGVLRGPCLLSLLAFGRGSICPRLPKAVQFTYYVIINSAHVYSPNSPSLVWMINSTVSLVFCLFLSSSLLRSHISIYNLSPRHQVPCDALGFLHFSAVAAFNSMLLQASATLGRLLVGLQTFVFTMIPFIHLWVSLLKHLE